ncbi:hypothetical protein GF373_17850 [bacterium]|nr:hypothetical protein [bacterium]
MKNPEQYNRISTAILKREEAEGHIVSMQHERIEKLEHLLTESLKRLEFAKQRDPDQAGLYHYKDAIDFIDFKGID